MDPEVPCSSQGGGTKSPCSCYTQNMKLAVISDIHGNVSALEAVLSDIKRRSISRIVNLGDSLSGPFDAASTADLLLQLELPTVRGNHDRMLIDRPPEEMGTWERWIIDELTERHLDWVRSLPEVLQLDELFLCHATPNSDEVNWLDHRGPDNRLIERDLAEIEMWANGLKSSVILCGHTHTPRVVRLPDRRIIVNPGSVGCPAYLDTRSDPPFVHQTGSPDARYAILELFKGEWNVLMVAVPYESSSMARLARERGADSWARAVETGWFA